MDLDSVLVASWDEVVEEVPHHPPMHEEHVQVEGQSSLEVQEQALRVADEAEKLVLTFLLCLTWRMWARKQARMLRRMQISVRPTRFGSDV